MKSAHNPRSLIVIILILVAAVFLTSTLRLFHSTAHAAGNSSAQSTITLAPTPAFTSAITPTPTSAASVKTSADTLGIIALATVIVATVVAGSAWGLSKSRPVKNKRR